jgi:hypothetical protein
VKFIFLNIQPFTIIGLCIKVEDLPNRIEFICVIIHPGILVIGVEHTPKLNIKFPLLAALEDVEF